MSSQEQHSATQAIERLFRRASTASVAEAAGKIRIEDFNFYTPNESTRSPKNTHFLASAIAHGLDGWEYLGMALMSHLHGRHIIAFHLAYYAQLRAAKSFLCCNGIHIKSKRIHVLENGKDTGTEFKEIIPGTSHGIIWRIHNEMPVESWGVNLCGLNVKECISPIMPDKIGVGTTSATLDKLKQQLGRDSIVSTKMQDYRNGISYQAQSIINGEAGEEPIGEKYDFAKKFWEEMDPNKSIGLSAIRSILRNIMISSKISTSKDKKRYNAEIETALENNIGAEEIKWIIKELHKEDRQDILFLAKQEKDLIEENFSRIEPRYVKHAISRGALLLQIASDACKDRIKRSQNAKSVAHKVAGFFGEKKALWRGDVVPQNYAILYDPVEDALEIRDEGDDAGKWRCIQAISELGCERIALWLLNQDYEPES